MNSTTPMTRSIHFDRIGDAEWRLRTRLEGNTIALDIETVFIRDAHPIWIQERAALQQAHDVIAEWLALNLDQDEPSLQGS